LLQCTYIPHISNYLLSFNWPCFRVFLQKILTKCI